MGAVKLAVIFYSMTGTNYRLAQWAAEGGKEQGARHNARTIETVFRYHREVMVPWQVS
ncbi:hypothetical protein SAMN04488689_102602 [Paenibacillus sp. cl6col]|nr:hypothetical protein SAMN04488689_102602 [Paenibacillus sp. cl6col]